MTTRFFPVSIFGDVPRVGDVGTVTFRSLENEFLACFTRVEPATGFHRRWFRHCPDATNHGIHWHQASPEEEKEQRSQEGWFEWMRRLLWRPWRSRHARPPLYLHTRAFRRGFTLNRVLEVTIRPFENPQSHVSESLVMVVGSRAGHGMLTEVREHTEEAPRAGGFRADTCARFPVQIDETDYLKTVSGSGIVFEAAFIPTKES